MSWLESQENFVRWMSVWSPDLDLAVTGVTVTTLGFAAVAAGVEWWSDFYAPFCRPMVSITGLKRAFCMG